MLVATTYLSGFSLETAWRFAGFSALPSDADNRFFDRISTDPASVAGAAVPAEPEIETLRSKPKKKENKKRAYAGQYWETTFHAGTTKAGTVVNVRIVCSHSRESK